jgi:UDP-glucose-4-epimerase GalE
MTPRRVLVTGGAGFVGSHACKALLRAGYEPVAYDNLSRGHARLARFGPLIHGDLHDGATLRDVLAAVRPVACLHFAAFAYVAESMHDPALYWRNNVAGTLSLLEALRDRGVDKIVFSSTCAVYGQADSSPIPESAVKRPLSPYGRTKLAVEEMLADFGRAFGTRSVCLRYFNAAGADPEGEVGEWHDPEPHVIPRALMAAAGAIAGFDVLGDDYATPDGTAVRDYTHVSDLAAAHVAALERLLSGGASDSFNLGLGRGCSVLEILRAAERVTGRAIRSATRPRRAGDPATVVADPSRARAELGFEAEHPDLDEMVLTAWRWFQANGFRAAS